MKIKTHTAADLRVLADAITGAVADASYRPTLQDAAMADAFDRCMADLGRTTRAWRGGSWRGSRAEGR